METNKLEAKSLIRSRCDPVLYKKEQEINYKSFLLDKLIGILTKIKNMIYIKK